MSFITKTIAVAAVMVPVHHPAHHSCIKRYTMPMLTRALDATYWGAHTPPAGSTGRVKRYVFCQRHHSNVRTALKLWRTARQDNTDQRMPVAVASWYEDAGETASGYHAYYGIANKYLAFGTRVLICYPAHTSHCVNTTVDDRGPYIAGRDWDLNQNTAGALGFGGVDDVSYTVK